MLSLDQLSRMVKDHLGLDEYVDDKQCSTKWIVTESSLGGRGLIAVEDIPSGEVLYVDRPLIRGPRGGNTIQRGCTVCSSLESEMFLKCDMCALLLCSPECQQTSEHYDDCAIIKRWNKKVPVEEIDDTLMSKALTAIRSLLLNEDQKLFMASLEAHMMPQHWTEIRNILQYFDIPEHEQKTMVLACCALDANAYQIATPHRKNAMSRRGLYPVAGLMNHNCVPNTRHCFNENDQMTVKATKLLRAGTELFTCYSGLLWGTPSRRMHLFKTKHFLCKCDRCADPSERGTQLAALKCFATECPGSLLPIEPLKSTTAWRCLECNMRVPHNNISIVQNALGSMMTVLDFENVNDLENFLLNRAFKFIPKTNQIIVDLQCRLIWQFGEAQGLSLPELSEPRLALKESLCRGTLRSLAALGAGDGHLRGHLLYHLHAALAERARRHPHLYEELKSEIESTIEQAHLILQGDISAPPDLELRRKYLGPGCDKPHQERFFILDS